MQQKRFAKFFRYNFGIRSSLLYAPDELALENTLRSRIATIAFTLVIVMVNSCAAQERRDVAGLANSKFDPRKLETILLKNAIQIHDKVISGGQPEGEQAFRELKELGVKTIISVDGARTEVALARKYGLRYVHLPHGYNGILPERAQELAKGVRDLEGPIYVHCHLGKHRSPAAAAVACVSAGLIEPESTMAILRLAGSNENYRGLFQSVASARRLPDSMLDALQADFPESAKLPPMTTAMVELERTHDQLKQIAASGLQTLPDHPDLDPAHEALLLSEHFTEMLRMQVVAEQPEAFRTMLKASESDAQQLEAAIRQWNRPAISNTVPESIIEPFRRISENCATCHRHYRDLPIDGAK